MLEFLQILTHGHEVAYALIVLALVAVLGLGIGDIKLAGIKLGVAGVLFAGLAFGHFGVAVDARVLDFAREFGLILFVYTIGVQVGPGFFASLRKDGLPLNLMAAAIVLLGVLTAMAVHLVAGIELPVVLGLFSGAVTNTPSLAAGQQMLKELGADGTAQSLPGLGYAVAYPFGIIGILLTMLLVRRLFRLDPQAEADRFDAARRAAYQPLETLNLEVTNPNLAGLTVGQIPGLKGLGVVVSRILHGGTQEVAGPDHPIAMGDVLLAVGPRAKLEELRLIVGAVSDHDLKAEPSELKWERLVVTNSAVLGHALGSLDFLPRHGVTISRLNRAGVELVPAPDLKLQFGDIVTAIGTPGALTAVAGHVGNKANLLQHAQIAPIFIGIALGVFLGSIPIAVPGFPAPLKLGLAGGPLIAAIMLSRIGHLGPLVWFMPPGANLAIREIGIILFLAAVGLRSGGRFVETVVEGDGLLWMGAAALITLVPLLVVALFAHLVRKTNYLTLCGLLSGSMTDPPALAFANAITPSEAPALAYSTVYPLVMFLRVMAPQVMALILWSGV